MRDGPQRVSLQGQPTRRQLQRYQLLHATPLRGHGLQEHFMILLRQQLRSWSRCAA